MSGSVPYLIAGFGLTWAAVVLYAWRLESRLEEARGRLDRHGEGGPRVQAPDDGAAGGPTAAEPEQGREETR